MRPFFDTLLAALPYGALLGVVFAPLRLAGVDYSKWYRDPGEISERDDGSWIGLMKWTALHSGRWLVGLLLAVAVAFALLDLAVRQIDPAYTSSLDLLRLREWWRWPVLFGLLAGAAPIQAVFEATWRWGLRFKLPQAQIRLARRQRPPAPPKAAAAERVKCRRRIIICCDGTWNSPNERRETNVVQLLRAITPVGVADGGAVQQIAYYHLGVGTGNLLDQYLGGGAGIGLSSSVKACYGFLVDNYTRGDEILLFGFSRGAYVVRSLAGMIGLVGLLTKEEMVCFLEVWRYYTLPRGKRSPGILDAVAPRRERNVPIRCVGVWDTVGALGIPGTRLCSSAYGFHETSLGPHVRYAFQALAMDERRGNFQPAVWVKQCDDPQQVLEQVWFPGVHSDIGGGYVQHGLSDTTLLWMLSRLQHYQLLDINMTYVTGAVERFHAEPYSQGMLHDSRSFFWKLIASPIPRPVGITDVSEKVDGSATERANMAITADAYARPARKQWLESLGQAAIHPTGAFVLGHTFQGQGNGVMVPPLVLPSQGICDRVLRWLFGQA